MVTARADFVVDYLSNGELSVAFPYDSLAVQIVRAMPGRRWRANAKYWTIPRTALRPLQEQAGRAGIGVAVSERVRQALNMGRDRQRALLATKTDETPLPLPTSTQPYGFQYAGIRFAQYALHNFRGALIAHDLGLGKSLMALSLIALHPKLQNILVLCPATLKYTWAGEIEKHYPQLSYVVIDGGPRQRAKLWTSESRIKIANYEILLRDFEPRLTTWDLVIGDECVAPESMIWTEVGLLPISRIINEHLNLRVWSYSFSEQKWQLQPIIRWLKNFQIAPFVKLGCLRLTPNHSLPLDGLGRIMFLKNYELLGGSVSGVRQASQPRLSVFDSDVPLLRQGLFREMAYTPARSSSESLFFGGAEEDWFGGNCGAFRTPRKTGLETKEREACKLLRRAAGTAFRTNEANEALALWREWSPFLAQTGEASAGFGVAQRIYSQDWGDAPHQLQDRCGESRAEDCYRGWESSQSGEAAMVQAQWMDVPSFLQSYGGGLDGGRSSDGYVYNLEIEKNHNYVADGLLVNNCTWIKSFKAQRTKRAKKLKRRYTLALSGIPLENNLDELHSVMDFVIPGLLGPGYLFHEQHAVKDAFGHVRGWRGLEEVRQRIAPYYIRRTKAEVLQELPDKVYNDVSLELSSPEWELYTNIVQQIRDKVEENPKLSATNILTEMLRLKQCTSDPRLLNVDIEGTKVAALRDILEVAGDHKIVIFTQFAQLATLLAEEFECPVIQGDVKPIDRAGIVESFQRGEHRCLVSTEAGAYGITLTAADIVVHHDILWNPARMRQREDRLHRIGQKSSVQVVTLVARRTIDEKIRKLLHKKLSLVKAILEEETPEEDARSLSRSDLLELLDD